MVAKERDVTPPAPTPTEGFYVDKDDVNGFFPPRIFSYGSELNFFKRLSYTLMKTSMKSDLRILNLKYRKGGGAQM
jgi:hypothetical protein